VDALEAARDCQLLPKDFAELGAFACTKRKRTPSAAKLSSPPSESKPNRPSDVTYTPSY
jgi:hypothetical protein